VSLIKAALEDFLEEMRSRFKCRKIAFSHAKFRFELEIPADIVKGNKKPADFEFTS